MSRHPNSVRFVAFLVTICLSGLTAPARGRATATMPSNGAAHARTERFGALPLRFETNVGQTDGRVRFLARGAGATTFLTADSATVRVQASRPRSLDAAHRIESLAKDAPEPAAAVRIRFVGAASENEVVGEYELPGRTNYLVGNDPAQWHTDVVSYAQVRIKSLYTGVDAVFYGNDGQLEYDFVVAPGADASRVRLTFDGADEVHIDGSGDLTIATPAGDIRQHRPTLYQTDANGARREVEGRYRALGNGEIGFEVGAFDASRSLVIDPVLVFSTSVGGSLVDGADAVAVDKAGNIYVAGTTETLDFPTTVGVLGATGGGTDAFVTKLDPLGTSILYSTYFGGNGDDVAHGLAVSSSGTAYVVGKTSSSDLPAQYGYSSVGRGVDAFLIRVASTGSSLEYCTYFGGDGDDEAWGVAADNAGHAYVTGTTQGFFFPLSTPFDSTFDGPTDAFLAKFDVFADTSSLLYSTYLGGSGDDTGYAVAIDSAGFAYVAGAYSLPPTPRSGVFPSSLVSFPFTNAIQPGFGGEQDAFLAKFTPGGNQIVYSTSLGGRMADRATGVAVDASGAAYVTGETESADFPLWLPAQPALAGGTDAFVAKIDSSGSAFVYSTYLGGDGDDAGSSVAFDSSGRAYVAGTTRSADFPAVDAYQASIAGASDAFVAAYSGDGIPFWTTYLGGSDLDSGSGVAIDASGALDVVGTTRSADFPTNGGQSFGPGGETDAFVAKLYPTASGVAPDAPSDASATATSSSQITLNWTDNSLAETCFKIERRSAPSGPWIQVAIASANATSFQDSGLEASAAYDYRVRASNGPDDSSYSNEASATTFAATIRPTAPQNVIARALSASTVAIAWTDRSTSETGFEIERRLNSDFVWVPVGTAGANAVSFLDATVPAPNTYVYHVRAINGFGASSYTSGAPVTVSPVTLAPPGQLHTQATSAASVQLVWTDTSTNESGFKVERKIGMGGTWTVTGFAQANTTGFYDNRLESGVTYFYRVRAVRGSDESAPSNEVSGTVPNVPAPGFPFASQVTPTEVTLHWSSSGQTASYVVERKLGPGGAYHQVGPRATSSLFVDTGLSPETNYVYRVRAEIGSEEDGYARSPYSSEVPVTTPALPVPGATILVTSALDGNVRDATLTLREAILVANGTLSVGSLTPQEQSLVTGTPVAPGLDAIAFAIGSGKQTIALGSPLPSLSDAVTIDATTQPGYAGTPLVEITGSGAGAATNGLEIGAGGCTVRGLAIGGFSANGIDVDAAAGTAVESCYIGVDPSGGTARPNSENGIRIADSADCVIRQCLISGNTGAGVLVSGFTTANLRIVGNRIGTNAAGTLPVGNGTGILFTNAAFQTRVGGTDPADGNVISGNVGHGISAAPGAGGGHVILNNMIGVDQTGSVPLGNGGFGVSCEGASENWFEGDVVSANGLGGLKLCGSDNRVQGCRIGTSKSGTSAIGNQGDGILLVDSPTNFIGIGGPPYANVIGGNAGCGIRITGNSDGNHIFGNYIGVDISGRVALGQTEDGIRIEGGSLTFVGWSAAYRQNVIANNGGAGVAILGGENHWVSWNSIYGNTGIGIDLGPAGPTPNDPGDADSGPNGLQNAPELSAAAYAGTTLVVTGQLDSTPNQPFVVDLYASRLNASGGNDLIASTFVRTGSDGIVPLLFEVTTGLPNGSTVRAIATSAATDTANSSEFSNGVAVTGRTLGSRTPGIYLASSGAWFLKNTNAPGGADLLFTFGPSASSLVPLAGDWDGDGTATPGLYDPASGAFFLKNSNAPGPADLVFTFGPGGTGWTPLVGDWNGDGTDTIGLYVPASGTVFLKNTNTPGPADLAFGFGPGGSDVLPLTGDWNGDGVDTIGIYAISSGALFLKNANASGGADLVFTFGPGGTGFTPIAGDWNGDGTDSIGLYVPASGTWFLRNSNSSGGADLAFSYGPPDATPITGNWDGL